MLPWSFPFSTAHVRIVECGPCWKDLARWFEIPWTEAHYSQGETVSAHEPAMLREAAYQSFAEGRLEEALLQLRSLAEGAGLDLPLCNDLAVVAFKLGRTQDAIGYFREAQRLKQEAEGLLVDNLIDALEGAVSRAQAGGSGTVQPAALEGGADDRFSEWLADNASALHAAAQRLSDDQWALALFNSVSGKRLDGHLLPAFIGEEQQRIFVGSSGVTALQEGHRFVQVLLSQLAKHGLTLSDDSVAVDFGSGWGRYTRFMLKYVHPDNLYGLEVNPAMVEHCRKAFGMANFLKVETLPPCPLRNGLVDLVFGYSVLSHLAPHCADAWISEFARITKPGGLVLMTTQGRSFIDFCRGVRESGDRSHPWFISLSKAFINSEQAYRDYDAGQFLHFGEGQYGGTYGESLIPKGYIGRHWQTYFDLIDFIDDRAVLPQALFVLRRNGVSHAG